VGWEIFLENFIFFQKISSDNFPEYFQYFSHNFDNNNNNIVIIIL